ncbi:MAG: TolC family protein [Bacteriovoracia bacterium]
MNSKDESISLEQVLQLATHQNPQRKEADAGVKAAAEAITAREPLLPPPTFTVGSMGSSGPFSSSGHMETSFAISQTIPFPTKTFSNRSALRSSLKATQASEQAFTLELKNRVKKAYYAYLEASQKLSLLQELRGVYRHHLKRLRSGPVQDQLMKAHLMSAQTEIDLIQNEMIEATERLEIHRGELNVLIGKDAYAPLGNPESRPLSPLPEKLDQKKFQELSARHPELLAVDAGLQAVTAERAAARSAWLPDFMLSYRVNRRYDTVPNNSEVMVGVSLPFVTFWQPRSQNAEMNARLDMAHAQQLQKQNEFSLRSLRTQAMLSSLHQQLINLENRLVPQAKRRVDLVTSSSPTDMNYLDEHRAALEQYVKLKLQAVEKKTQYEMAISELESLTNLSASDVSGAKE